MGGNEKSNKSSGSSQTVHSAKPAKLKGSDWWPPEALERPLTGSEEPASTVTELTITGSPGVPAPVLATEIMTRVMPRLEHMSGQRGIPLDLTSPSVARGILDMVAVMIEEALLMYHEHTRG